MLAGSTALAQQRIAGLDEELLRETVETVATVVDREYFDVQMAARAAHIVREGLAEGRYDRAETLEVLTELLTRDLFEATDDKNLVVAAIPYRSLRSSSAPEADRGVRGRRENFGVQLAEVLAGHVGYLNLTAFYRPDEAGEAIGAAMRMLRSADALILDLRENSGGSPDTVALLASYVFDASELPLFRIVPRSGGEGRWSEKYAARR